MDYWFDTSHTIVSGVGFKQFDALHLIWLALCAGFIGFSCWLYRKNTDWRKALRHGYALAILADELLVLAGLLYAGNFRAEYLPLHLCSINIFLVLWHGWHPGKVVGNFLYAVCIPGALLALFFPSWTKLPLWNLMHLHSFTLHALLIAYPLMQVSSGDIRPEPRYAPHCLGLLSILGCVALAANVLLDTNFMFLMYAPKSNPLYWFETQFGNHLLGIPVLLPLVLGLMYLPFLRQPKRHQQVMHTL